MASGSLLQIPFSGRIIRPLVELLIYGRKQLHEGQNKDRKVTAG
jgi:hypothetical protein